MGKISTAVVLGALAGVGYYIGKKVFDKKQAEKESGAQPEVFVEERHSTPKEKLQRASLFAVGAIKTGTEKIKEGLDEIVDNDMISKGEVTVSEMKSFASDAKDKTVAFAKETKDKTVAFAKDKTGAFKDEIDNLKGMVSSINTGAGEAPEEESSIVDAAMDAVNDFAEEGAGFPETSAEDFVEAAETFSEEAADSFSEAAESFSEAAEEIAEAAEEIVSASDEIAQAADEIESLSFEEGGSDTVDTFDFSSADKL